MNKNVVVNAKSNTGTADLVQQAIQHTLFSMVPKSDLDVLGPTIFTSASGVRFRDQNDVELLDMMSTPTRANSLGFGREEVAWAMYEQARHVHYTGTGLNLSSASVELAAKVAGLAPGDLSKVCFVSGGSEATETALKLAKQYQQLGRKPRAYKVISRWNAYHGSTVGALSVTNWLGVRDIPDPRMPGYSFVANPMTYRNPFGMSVEDYTDLCVRHLERQILCEGPELVAAFIGEPIMQANGVQIPHGDYWQRVREVCDKYDVLLILDEVITGFGRTGKWFAAEHFGIVPDILTMAKAMGAGYAPIGAVITTETIADALPMFRHVHTFGGHAVACAAASAVIEIKEKDKLIEKADKVGAEFSASLSEKIIDLPIVGEVRGLGFWHAIDFTENKNTKAAFADDTVSAIVRRIRDHGVIVGLTGSSLEIAPPLICDEADLAQTIEVCAQSIREITSERQLA